MLPGIRFLFAAVVLTVSLVVFGLGAAALLRSAHEEFAAIPTRRAPPQTVFAQQVETPPTLAILRVDSPAPDPAPPAESAAVPAEPAAVIAPPADAAKPSETVAALSAPVEAPSAAPVELARPETIKPEASNSEAAKPETPKPEAVKTETAPEPVTTVAVAPVIATPAAAAPADATDIPALKIEPAPASEPTATLTEDDTRLTSSKIATLGGPPVDTEPVPLPVTRPTVQPVKKVEKKRVTVKKRRVAARVAPAPPPQLDPFGQPIAR